jgi:NADH-quinone oxidoreductase subunit E
MAVRRLAESQPDSFVFSAENMAWAERQIARFPEGRQASAVIALLWRAQEQEGWITKPAIERVAEILKMPFIRVLEVATFYTMFHLEPVGRKAHIQVCGTTPCMLRGAGHLIDICRRRIHEHPHHLSPSGDFSWEEVECLGACVNAPMVQISKDTYEDLIPETFDALIDAFERGEPPMPGPQNGRQHSMPITGLTSLTEIEYADHDIRETRVSAARDGARGRAAQGGGPDAMRLDEPRPGAVGNVGGEYLESEQQRRKGRLPEKAGGADPAGPGTADEEIARVDPAGRSDEAAARAMGERPLRGDEGRETKGAAPTRTGEDRAAQPRSDRDSSAGDREG